MVEINPGAWLAEVRANVTKDRWIVFDIMSFGYSLKCLTIPDAPFTAASPRIDVYQAVHGDFCLDYEIKRIPAA